MLAETNYTGIAIIALGALRGLVTVGALVLRNRGRGRGAEIPSAMRPGPSDAALEAPVFHKLQGWGVLLLAFFVLWFPFTWLLEPNTNESQEAELLNLARERGALAVQPFSEENQLGVGCVRCHGPELRGGIIQSGDGFAQPPNLTNICEGNLNGAHPAIASVDDIYQVIEQGRLPAMPSWSIRYAGALTDQQINDIVVYLIEMSSENVPFENNICLNEEAETRAIEKALAEGIVLERP
ncbi:MAG TPA: cytochrome c [Actinomycetota bacterium]|nr:cytochrome c [Actinomycetota bacterium]